MNKALFLLLFSGFLILSSPAFSQIQKGNVLIGGDIANFDLGLKKGSEFHMAITPKLAFFIKDNVAVGAYLNFDLTTVSKSTTVNYGAGLLGRYYFSDKKNITPLRHSRFFVEGNVGIRGINPATGSSTNGLDLGAGPGFAYFISSNVGLETLLKYDGIVGFGNATTQSDLKLVIGFQIHLHSKRTVSKVMSDVK